MLDVITTCTVYLRDRGSQIIVRAATLRKISQSNCLNPPSHGSQTPGRPLLALTPSRQAPGRAATGVSVLRSVT